MVVKVIASVLPLVKDGSRVRKGGLPVTSLPCARVGSRGQTLRRTDKVVSPVLIPGLTN